MSQAFLYVLLQTIARYVILIATLRNLKNPIAYVRLVLVRELTLYVKIRTVVLFQHDLVVLWLKRGVLSNLEKYLFYLVNI